jgi:hypothetical protein
MIRQTLHRPSQDHSAHKSNPVKQLQSLKKLWRGCRLVTTDAAEAGDRPQQDPAGTYPKARQDRIIRMAHEIIVDDVQRPVACRHRSVVARRGTVVVGLIG